ncbi:hypothetical protein [Synechococcus phage BUCT-ZZ01]|nr:hypothetical protein [Synechococcus phage BUCT-ZZ01]
MQATKKNDIADFLQIVSEANKKKEQAQAESKAKQAETAAPFLSELFNVVADTKKKSESKRIEEKKKAEPILKSLEEVLKNPEQAKPVVAKQKVLEVVRNLEDKANELERKLAEETSLRSEINQLESSTALTALEKKFLDLFKKVQNDFENLKKYTTNAHTSDQFNYGWSAGSGEVNLRYLDDVNASTIADGLFLRYDAATKKFVFSAVESVANLRDLQDVEVNNIPNGYVLSYNSSLDKFVFVPPSTGGAGSSNTTGFRTTVNVTPEAPAVINHNLNLPFKESLVVNTFLGGERVDTRIIAVDVNSIRIETEIAVTGLFVSIVGIL